jgi:NAD+ kinase
VKIGIYGKQLTHEFKPVLNQLFDSLLKHGIKTWIHPNFLAFFQENTFDFSKYQSIFIFEKEMPENLDCLITLGGDGTFLETITAINLKQIPLLGINTGRLGFLADISPVEIPQAIDSLVSGKYRLEERMVLKASLQTDLGISLPYALNELTVHKRDTSSMILIHAYIDDVFLTHYWADGLIIATPTGSTAYSMSVGGPIVSPDSQTFIITPIASHNLTVRPLVIPNHHEISLRIESRDSKFLLSLDSRSYVIEESLEVRVKKAETNVTLIKMDNQNFFHTIRTKLMWGIDKRN